MDVFVRQNDSLWYYSQLFKVNYQLIIDSNSGIDPLALMIGQQIKIPGFTTSGKLPGHAIFHWMPYF